MVSVVPRCLLVFLRGGPSDLSGVREVEFEGLEDRLKIPRGNGYEHFELTRELKDVGERPVPVYRWLYRTAIAE
ncbi:DUF5988 family protein [Kitasatospora sp. RB6PN24]|uniref:DUF5988 family protein n=1 Tax=Kitasatospora humi TaxID=2893891 RepID=UPI001E3C1AA6|nr:DUF5988 family protein [Kitasatospora humi]MCC9312401.1 DUF5988 family protein [Kitasatospora humi]